MIRTLEEIAPFVKYNCFTNKLDFIGLESIANGDGKNEFIIEVLDLVNKEEKTAVTPVLIHGLNEKIKRIFMKYHNLEKIFYNTRHIYGYGTE